MTAQSASAATEATPFRRKKSILVKKPVKQPTKYGYINRMNFSLTCELKSGEVLVLAPKQVTGREFLDGDVVKVQNTTTQEAIRMGYISIQR